MEVSKRICMADEINKIENETVREIFKTITLFDFIDLLDEAKRFNEFYKED